MNKKGKKYKEYLFVDGYNIINSWSELRELSSLNLEVAREELIEIMAEYQYYSGIKVIIVFDAHMVKKNVGKKETIKDVDVVYTKENETADQYIERVLDHIGKSKRIRVATSDWMEQQIVLSRGGTRISARELEAEIKDQKRMMMKRRSEEEKKSELFIGRLDEETIKKLDLWQKNNE
ncbi:NYN domain-containing protein [Tepidimicrobium xylanilyticum]|uniref:NYN domain-containing protein n=1 Tax=Tepidimicrobium xylanilyticum TaxID=1123352 RepID=UPI002656BA75|nr:NYN domain-containing protein [Tepidimicrobium xylanilyticum]GMG97889.1 ribonuclease [Tepidimicrobium xylanilyticum]